MIRPSDYIAALVVDFYKLSHIGMVEDEVSQIYSNITPRSSRLMGELADYDDKALLVGIQRALDDIFTLWQDGFFSLNKDYVIQRIRRRLLLSMSDNAKADYICKKFAVLHDIGFLPVTIKSLPEGRRVDMRVPFLTIRNTRKEVKYLTNFLETILSTEIWKTVVNATRAFGYRRILSKAAIETTGSDNGVLFQAHDFSMRGMSGFIDASNTGIAHLSCFRGTDTVSAIEVVEKHYNPRPETCIGVSVPATEHMVICLKGEKLEFETIRRIIEDEFPTGVVSIVSDTWNLWRVLTDYVPRLKDVILARKPDSSGMAKVVFRPDSGDPELIICGNPAAAYGSPEYKGVVGCLWDVFGGEVNDLGYRVLHDAVGAIYGDSITPVRAQKITSRLKEKGYASLATVLGVGSFSYQYVTRDNLSVTMKATQATINGVSHDLIKDPITDDGTKKSASGLLRVDEVDGRYVLKQHCTSEEEEGGELIERFRDGQFYNRMSWETVCENMEYELRVVLTKLNVKPQRFYGEYS